MQGCHYFVLGPDFISYYLEKLHNHNYIVEWKPTRIMKWIQAIVSEETNQINNFLDKYFVFLEQAWQQSYCFHKPFITKPFQVAYTKKTSPLNGAIKNYKIIRQVYNESSCNKLLIF